MACSKYEVGYEDNRFEIEVSQRFHCPICFLVLKDPVMCKNEHCYCSSCIKKHLEKSASCPTCREHLSVDTLRQASRIVKDYISELNIHCDFYPRGCREIVQVENLKRHVASCGFSPVQCSNEGCDAVVNTRDKLHHEAEVCDLRKLKCHDCADVKDLLFQMLAGQHQMKDEIKAELKRGMNEVKNEMKAMKNEIKQETKGVKSGMKGMKDEMNGMKEGINEEVKVVMSEMKEEIKNEVKGEMKEVKNETKVMKNEIKVEMKGEMNTMREEIKNEMKGIKEEIKVEVNVMKVVVQFEVSSKINEMRGEINNGMKGMNEEIKVEVMGEMNEQREEIKNELKGMKEEIKVEVKGEMKEVKNEIKAVKNEIKQETKGIKNGMKATKDEMKGMKEEIKVEVKGEMKEVKNEMKAMKNEMKQETKGIKSGMNGMKAEIKNEIKEIVTNAIKYAMVESKDLKAEGKYGEQSPQTTSSPAKTTSIIIAGGEHEKDGQQVCSTSVEMFDWPTQSWKKLNPLLKGRSKASSFVYKSHITVVGGSSNSGSTDTIESLNVADPAALWKDSVLKIPVECSGHKVVNYNDQLIMSGGWTIPTEGGLSTRSDAVYEVNLVPPYSSKILARLPQPRCYHGMEIFDQKLLILGGVDGDKKTNSVVQYDLIKNECKEMPPLPHAVKFIATVLWRNNVLVIGGIDPLGVSNSVLMYDVITGRAHVLPCMKRKRYGCTAVLNGNVVVVMGGRNGEHRRLKSVECLDLESQVWQDMPDMLIERAFATAVTVEAT